MTSEVAASGKRIVAATQSDLRMLGDVGVCIDRHDVVSGIRLDGQLTKMRARHRRHVIAGTEIDLSIFSHRYVVLHIDGINSSTALNNQVTAESCHP